MPGEADELASIISLCRGNSAFLRELAGILELAGHRMEDQGFRCMGGGGCCKFDLADFRLFLSTGELALLSAQPAPTPLNLRLGRCPYQVGPRCAAHGARPLGCRIHFCDSRASSSMSDGYEQSHLAIRRLHGESRLPYRYGELVSSLILLGSIESR